jgi:predicted secreted protein
MAISTSIAIYFLIWWITLFAVLPWGIRTQNEDSSVVPGTDPGAPTVPRLLNKLIWTTVVATILWVICAVVYANRLITLDDLATLLRVSH